MVELEFMVGKVHVAMKIARIKLNVVSCYALTEAGWETILGSAHQSALVNPKNCRRLIPSSHVKPCEAM